MIVYLHVAQFTTKLRELNTYTLHTALVMYFAAL